jgi:CheY-like chemotaxis protein
LFELAQVQLLSSQAVVDFTVLMVRSACARCDVMRFLPAREMPTASNCMYQRHITQFNESFRTQTSAQSKYKILVVDDDLELNTSFALLLEFDGHEVHTANTGEAALEKLGKNHFDLLISEYWLPRMTGDQLAGLVKQRWPDLPIIMVTANFEEIQMDDLQIAGVHCLLDKPFTMNQLREAMNWALGHPEPTEVGERELHWVHHGDQRASADGPKAAPGESDDF